MIDLMGVSKESAIRVLGEDLEAYKETRFRLTARLSVLNRVQADPQQRNGLTEELSKLEEVIDRYESIITELSG